MKMGRQDFEVAVGADQILIDVFRWEVVKRRRFKSVSAAILRSKSGKSQLAFGLPAVRIHVLAQKCHFLHAHFTNA
jgi:hypothetical protein